MDRKCLRCKNKIVELILSDKQRVEIWGLLTQDLKLFIVKKLKDEYGYEHGEAKIIVDHLNKDFGKCGRCDYDQLSVEYVDCPKCKAFNYNLYIQPPFNADFCAHLENRLNFDDLDNEELSGFWCDGVSHLPYDIISLTKSNIEKNKKITTKAWIGKDGQDEYEMTIYFGDLAVEKYKAGLALTDCIPEGTCKEWMSIQISKKTITLKLK